MISCIIVENEVRCVNVIQRLIETNDWLPLKTVSIVDSVSDAIAEINRSKPDLIFMDIELKDGSCFAIFDQLSHRNFQIIFTTAFDNFAVKAFKYSALDYLLKPIDNQEFKKALEKFSKSFKLNSIQENIENAAQLRNFDLDWKQQRIAIRKDDDVYFEKLEHIMAFKAKNAYTEILTVEGRTYLTSKNLGFYEDLATINPRFLRIHHSTIINLDYIASVQIPKNRLSTYITLRDNSKHEVSARRLSIIKELIEL
jgi:two-component system, LytTR family, response regulator